MSNDNLNHQTYKYEGDITNILDEHCLRLDQKHPLERKINFLLDIRGYLKVNNIKGSYVEFGSYKSEMQYCAYKILEPTGLIKNYVGLDTFKGEPELTKEESNSMPFIKKGSFESNFDVVKSFVDEKIGEKGHLVKGDFRKKEVLDLCKEYGKISVAVIDCNILSSIEHAINYILKNINPGGIIFIDDFYTNFAEGKSEINNLILRKFKDSRFNLLELGYYPPFAKSFIVTI